MIEGFLLNAADVGGWGLFVALCLFIVFAVIRGHLVPKVTVEEMRDRFKQAIDLERERANLYQEAANNYMDILSEATKSQADASQQQIEANTRILEALQKVGDLAHG